MQKVLVAALVALVCTSSSRAMASLYVDGVGQVSYARPHASTTIPSEAGSGGGAVLRLGFEYGGITHRSKGTHLNIGGYANLGFGFKSSPAEDSSGWTTYRIEPFVRGVFALSEHTDLAVGGAAGIGYDTARGGGNASSLLLAYVTGGVRHSGVFVEGGLGSGRDNNESFYRFLMGQAHYNFDDIPMTLGLILNLDFAPPDGSCVLTA